MSDQSTAFELQSNLAYWLDNLASRIQRIVRDIEAPYDFSWSDFETLEKIGSGERGLPLNHVVRPNPLGGEQNRHGERLFERFTQAGFVETEHEPDGLVRVHLTEQGRIFVAARQQAYQKLTEALADDASEKFLEDLKGAYKSLLRVGEFR